MRGAARDQTSDLISFRPVVPWTAPVFPTKAVETFQVIYDNLTEATGTAERLRRRAGRYGSRGLNAPVDARFYEKKKFQLSGRPSRREWRMEIQSLRRDVPPSPWPAGGCRGRAGNVSTASVEELSRLNVRRLDVFRPETQPDHPCRDAPQHGCQENDQLSQRPGEGEGFSSGSEHAAVDEDLSGLDAADGHLAAMLHGAEIVFGDVPLF